LSVVLSKRARFELALTHAWTGRGPLACALLPLAGLYAVGHAALRSLYRLGLLRPTRVGLPVVVVGNLYAGGTGKTPLTIELVRALAARGWQPGVISRGYGRHGGSARPVDRQARADEVGDEPLLIAQATGAPVVVGNDRVAAVRVLRSLHPACDLILCDDGLQHRRLARDFEIALLHFRGLGNGWLLPAGPLREPPSRLKQVDAVVLNGEVPPVRIYSPVFTMRTEAGDVYALKDPSHRAPLATLVDEQKAKAVRVVAAAGIAAPEKFFAMLRAAGLQFEEIALPDHYDFADNPFAGRVYDVALMTEKDAVKCRANNALAADGRLCVVGLCTHIDPALLELIEARIGAQRRHEGPTADGPSPA
jgi:tetraacyldisaccharide 4'-kinase